VNQQRNFAAGFEISISINDLIRTSGVSALTEFPEGYTTLTAIAELAAGVCAASTFIRASRVATFGGDVVLKLEGKPEQTYKAGQWFSGDVTAVLFATAVTLLKFKKSPMD
jgi:hypothetical protein